MDFSIDNFQYVQKNSCGNFTLSIPTFYIKKGEVIFLYGGSGSGKSTFFNLIAGVKKSTLGKDVRNSFPKIEYVMHESKLLPWHTLKNNIKVINKLNGSVDLEDLTLISQSLGLEKNILNMKNWQLSLGMRQRFEISIAIANKPDLIIFDEALSGIDNKHKVIVCKVLYGFIKKNQTAFLGTAHQISDILRLAERVIYIKDGVILNHIFIKSKSVEERLNMDLDQLYALPEAKLLINMNLE